MRTLIVLLGMAACGHKDIEPATGSAGSSAQPAPKPIDAATVTPKDATTPDATVAAAGKMCCCLSIGDAEHHTIEGDASACTADDMHGDCVKLEECELSVEPTRLVAGTTVTVDGSLLAIWPTKEAKAFGALEIKVHGKHATLRLDASIDGFKKAATIPATGPITVTAQSDGTALVSNGTTTWVLEQVYRYGEITVKKK